MTNRLQDFTEGKIERVAGAVHDLLHKGGTAEPRTLRTLKDIGDVRGKKIFLRLDFNVPIKDGAVAEDYRIKKALPTVKALQAAGAKLVMASHIETKDRQTLEPVFNYLKREFPDAAFVADYFPGEIPNPIKDLQPGGIALLENLRKYPGEKENDEKFAKHLASFADIYVDDAFAVAHRAHASVVGIPKLMPGYAGYLMEEEVANLAAAFNAPHPFVFILGGAKFDTKLPLVRKFLSLADTAFVGGALANDLYKAKGLEVGASLLSEGFDASDLLGSEKLAVPIDVVVENEQGRSVRKPDEIRKGDAIVDAGPETIEMLREKITGASFVLWNGPLGVFEKGYREGTDALAKVIAESDAKSVVGGGDTLASISNLGLDEKFTFISTGGGAMLDFLANGTLPGLEALKR